jgi:hypothetical protein
MTGVIDALGAMAREAPLPLAVAGACMAPGLRDGTCVRIEARRRYWPGDIVAFVDARGCIVLHRALGVRRGGALLTQADRSAAPDSAVPLDRVLGRVRRKTPLGERLQALVRFGRFACARLAARLP